MSKKQGAQPDQGGVIPDDAVENLASEAREAEARDEAGDEQAAAGARTPEPGEQADAETERKARRAQQAREKAEEEPAPKAAGGAGSKKADAGEKEEGEAGRRGSARRRAAETTTAPAPTRRRRDPEDTVSVRAQAKYVRCAPRKARLVIDHIRGRSVEDARAILLTTPRAASRDVLKLLDSCVANAENNHELAADELRVEKAYVDEGPTLKRYRPRALGRATRIRKRTSHMTIYLTNAEGR